MPKIKKPKKTFTYEIAVPVKETWIMFVEASSAKEAMERYEDVVSPYVEQNCSVPGWPYGGKTRVIRKRDEE